MSLMRLSREQWQKLRVGVVGGDKKGRAEVTSVLANFEEPELEVIETDLSGDTGARPEPDLSILVFGANQAASIRYLEAQAGRPHPPVLVAILPGHSPAAMRRVMHAGADEVLLRPLDAADLKRILVRLAQERRPPEHGSIYSIASLCGGVGVTTLSGGLALALRYAFDQSVGLIDLDLQSGGLDAFLHVEPDRSILPLTASTTTLDPSRLEATLTRHPSGVFLLAAPRRIDDSERVGDLTVAAALDHLRRSFDAVVVDCGRHVDANVVAAWERSEEVLYVLEPSVAAARSAARFRELFDHLGLRGIEPTMVLNKFRTHDALDQAQISDLAGAGPFALIPRDDRLLERAQLEAQDPWQLAPDSKFVRAIEDLARGLIQRRPQAAPRGKFIACRPTAIGPRI
jgi:pilus assembly protein CpaE